MPKLALGQRLFGLSLKLMPPTHKLPPKVVRKLFYWTDRLNGFPRISVHKIEELKIPISTNAKGVLHKFDDKNPETISARVYLSEAVAKSADEVLPTIVFFHSGGCVIGSIETHDGFCRHLANYARVNVVSVDYRLAPEYKFPVSICDAIDAWNWVVKNGDRLGLNTQKIGVAGDSAGGYLSLLLNLKSLQQNLPVQVNRQPDFQALMFPMLDLRAGRSSYDEHTSGLLLTKDVMLYFRDHYLNSEDEKHLPLASPILHDKLSECPPTYFLTVEFDPLRDEGKEMADKFKQAGVRVQHEHIEDCMHSFFSLTRLSKTAKDKTLTTIEQIGGFINSL